MSDHPVAGAAPATTGSKARLISFKVLAALFLLFILAAFNFMIWGPVVNWLPEEYFLEIRTELTAADLSHRLHSTCLSLILWGMAIGAAVQIHKPQDRIAPMLMALAVPPALMFAEAWTGTFTVSGTAPILVPLLLIALLHPSAGELVRVRGLDAIMAGLAAVAAVPWLVFAFGQARVHRLASAGHPDLAWGHWNFMIAFALLAITWSLIGATDRPGWRLVAWMAGVCAALYALQSLVFTGLDSAATTPWSVGALVWAVAYVFAAERRARRMRSR